MQNIQDQLNTIIKLFNNGEKQNAFNKIDLLLQTNKKNLEFEIKNLNYLKIKIKNSKNGNFF